MDEFFFNEELNFIKIDAEGAEIEILLGAERILKQQNQIKIVVAAYHWQNEEKVLIDLVVRNNFIHSFSNGYVCYYYEKEFKQPYLRRCLLQAKK